MKIRQITAAMVCALVIAGEAATAACAAERWNGNMEGRNAESQNGNTESRNTENRNTENRNTESRNAESQNGNTEGPNAESWDENVEITAHRGDSSEAPENTIPAFEAAIESGADWIELDVGVTKDGVLVVLHDEDLKRVAGDSRKIGELTFEEVRRLDVGSSFGPDFRGVGIPSLEEVLDYCQGRVLLNIEIKYRKGQDLAFIPRLVDLIRQRKMLDQCMITSFNYGCLQMVKIFEPALKTGLISSRPIAQPEIYTSADNFVLSIELIEPDTVNRIHELGKEVIAWTVNDQYSVEKCRKARTDNIITDNPDNIIPD